MPVVPWEGASRTPRRWQAEALPAVGQALRDGERPVVSATMGAGKSVLLTELVRLVGHRRQEDEVIVVAAPTQALVRQLSATVVERLGLEHVGVYYGRKKQPGRPVIVTCYPSVENLVYALRGMGKSVRMLVADECHQTEGDKIKTALRQLEPRWAVGFSATPYRSVTTETLELWTKVAYSYSLRDALNDRVLVPWRTIRTDDDTVMHRPGEELDTNALCARLIKAHAVGPGIVSAVSIDDAEGYAEFLCNEGLAAQAIHSKVPLRQQERLLRELRDGTLDALVHVSLLAEGVDMPWLRWLCMRRKVSARVRFAQEMGRVLRADAEDADKLATIIDPHDLLSQYGLAQPPALGERPKDGEDKDLLPKASLGEREPGVKRQEIPKALALGVADGWCRDLRQALDIAGLCRERFEPGRWRERQASRKQVHVLGRLSWALRYLPEEQRKTAKRYAARAAGLQSGTVADLIDVCAALADASKPARARRAHYQLPVEVVLKLPSGLDPALSAAVRTP